MGNSGKFQEDNLKQLSQIDENSLFQQLKSSKNGITNQEAKKRLEQNGPNTITYAKQKSLLKQIIQSYVSPFSIVLLLIIATNLVTNLMLPKNQDYSTIIIIVVIILISGTMKFVEERKSQISAKKLADSIKNKCTVLRDGKKEKIDTSELVVGDIVLIGVGDIMPAEMRIIENNGLQVNQSALTGESEPAVKHEGQYNGERALDADNILFMQSSISNGYGKGIVVATGNSTYYGSFASKLTKIQEQSPFDKGIADVSKLLLKFMLVMLPIVFVINAFTKHDVIQALLFSLSVAVGLTPEMLPMIVSTNLAKGSQGMAKKKCIVKSLNSIEDFGAMDVLCTDKTGTLTQDKIILQSYYDASGKEDNEVVIDACMNSGFQSGMSNAIDQSIVDYTKKHYLSDYQNIMQMKKIGELSFSFERRRVSVILDDGDNLHVVTKGAVEEMLSICTMYEDDQDHPTPFTDQLRQQIQKHIDELSEKGMRILVIAQRTLLKKYHTINTNQFEQNEIETEMVLVGYLALLDPPKDSAVKAVKALHQLGISLKVLTGDNGAVTRNITTQIGIPSPKVILGSDIEGMTDDVLQMIVEENNIFAKLSPDQKVRIVKMVEKNGHITGYMGDGINDAGALKVADIGVSVDNAVGITKDSANIILMEKDLNVLTDGVIEGRKTYANISKYIKMTASSNFGNILSIVIASAFLPFLPMLPVQLLVLNLMYDISCISIPFDNVDKDYITTPKRWSAQGIGHFMMVFGPVSSIFDVITYLVMFFIICSTILGGMYFSSLIDQSQFAVLFHTGWFCESLFTQILVVQMLRTDKIPILQSRPSAMVVMMTSFALIIGVFLPYSFIGPGLGLTPLPGIYYLFLTLIVVLYIVMISLVKTLYIRKYHELD